MTRVKTTPPSKRSREKYQRSLDIPDYLYRIIPNWGQPTWLSADVWRRFVRSQPLAMICRNTLISQITALDTIIDVRDSNKRNELSDTIRYYERLIEDFNGIGYAGAIEWILGDTLDIPFGGAVELGWENDTPPYETYFDSESSNQSKLLWVLPLDGGTLFPTGDKDFPVGQTVPGETRTIYFPSYAINRIYFNPRPELQYEGWGMPPPEIAYLAIEMLNRGDKYYADLLLDTPEVGILDLGDIDESSAKKWIESWRNLLNGIDPFKIPVLYGHESPAHFINFVRPPTELMFDKVIYHEATILAAAYGITTSDIGLGASPSGESLAGAIRQERKTKRTGIALLKRKLCFFFNKMLPPELEFKFNDLDDEISVALSRARLANASAWEILVRNGVFSPNEARQQTIADGLISISVPEEIEDDEKANLGDSEVDVENRFRVRESVPPSQGGQGEILPPNGISRGMLLDMLLEESQEFRETFSELEKIYESATPSQQAEIVEQMNEILSNMGYNQGTSDAHSI